MWVSKDSVYGNAFSLFLSMHLQGCKNIEILKNEKIKEKINSLSEWNKFTFVSSLA
jgi:glutaredoxin-related protein